MPTIPPGSAGCWDCLMWEVTYGVKCNRHGTDVDRAKVKARVDEAARRLGCRTDFSSLRKGPG